MDEFGEVMKILKRAGQLLGRRRALNCDRQALTRQTASRYLRTSLSPANPHSDAGLDSVHFQLKC
jgi:hypothetical protein